MTIDDPIRRIAADALRASQRAPQGHGDAPLVDAIEVVLRGALTVPPVAAWPISPETAARVVTALERFASSIPDPAAEKAKDEEQVREHRERVRVQTEQQKAAQERMERSMALNERQTVALEEIAAALKGRRLGGPR